MPIRSRRKTFYMRHGKRLVDAIAAGVALVLLSPVFAVTAVLVRTRLGSPVLFHQQRPGLHRKPFTMIKFRTMTDARDAQGCLLSDRERLTPYGAFLRSTSLDELPELINVLRGDMSLVGPRPLLMRYTAYFDKDELARFDVRPGITGLAQVSGRNDLNWDRRIQADVYYVRNLSLKLDLEILFKTFWRVFRRQGLQVDPGATMLDFDVERQLRDQLNDQNKRPPE